MRWIRVITLAGVALGACTSETTTGPGGPNPPPSGDEPFPLNGSGTYLGFTGGLYPGGNALPAAHATAGLALAAQIEPLNADGDPDPDGRYVLLSIGMSNTTQEFCNAAAAPDCADWTFIGQASADPDVDETSLAIVDGARGGQVANTWEAPDAENYDIVRDARLAPRGLTEAQVQVAWVKLANGNPTVSLPDEDADAFELERRLGNVVRALQARYPNLKLVFLSSRVYGGYATTPLNPEPYAFESGFSVKWLIEAQVEQMDGGGVDGVAGNLRYDDGTAPWLAWGPYLWADGETPNPEGLAWVRDDFEADGTHPSRSGEEKVADALLAFFVTAPHTTGWFLSGNQAPPPPPPPPPPPAGDTLVGVPLIDMTGTYLEFEGGLYPGGVNSPPVAHWNAGLEFAEQIEPLDESGNPSAGGRYGLMSLGMSNTRDSFCDSQQNEGPCGPNGFVGQALADPDVNTTTLVLANGAQGGQVASVWTDPASQTYDEAETLLSRQGLTEAQVQIVWVLQANPSPSVSLPDPNADAYQLFGYLGAIARAAKQRYPNLQMMFFSSRIYSCSRFGLNPEPYAYESGFSVKWLIEAQINQMATGVVDPVAGDLNYENGTAPWLGWSAYLWADDGNVRSDGLVWVDSDLADDCTHPGTPARQKVGAMLLDFFKTSALSTGWFLN